MGRTPGARVLHPVVPPWRFTLCATLPLRGAVPFDAGVTSMTCAYSSMSQLFRRRPHVSIEYFEPSVWDQSSSVGKRESSKLCKSATAGLVSKERVKAERR